MMRNSLLLFLSFSLALGACEDRTVFSQYHPIKNGVWDKEDTLRFAFSGLDTTLAYDLFIHIRNDDTFPFSNLFLIAEITDSQGTILKDTLEYQMAKPTGEWLGQGLGSLKENKLWLREKFVFPRSDHYRLNITHAVRKNGQVDGLHRLKGITDVGLEIERSLP